MKTFLLHILGSHVNVNTTFYYVHYNSCIVGICAARLVTTINRKVYALGKTETGIYVNMMQTTSYIKINDIFTAIVGYIHGVINNKPVITVS